MNTQNTYLNRENAKTGGIIVAAAAAVYGTYRGAKYLWNRFATEDAAKSTRTAKAKKTAKH